jgi:hypothetical protein
MDQCHKVSIPTDSKFQKQSQPGRKKKLKKNAKEEDADWISVSLITKLKQTLNLKEKSYFQTLSYLFYIPL